MGIELARAGLQLACSLLVLLVGLHVGRWIRRRDKLRADVQFNREAIDGLRIELAAIERDIADLSRDRRRKSRNHVESDND